MLSWFARCSGIAATIAVSGWLCGCAASAATLALATPSSSSFHVVAEGPCARLSVAAIGARRFILFGDTGYELADWNPGEELAAAQSLVEIRDDQAFRNPSWLRGVPTNEGGYVPGALTIGGPTDAEAWLLATSTRYAPHGVGSLFEREQSAFSRRDHAWIPSPSIDVVRLPRSSRDLPSLQTDSLCAAFGANQRFVRVASFVLEQTGDVWIAGRCQDDQHINTRPTRIRVAHGSPRERGWEITDVAASSQLDALVNIGLFARSPEDVWLNAWEPFKPVETRVPYVAHFDGKQWEVQHPPITTGVTCLSGSDDGTLWAAAGYSLWKRDRSGAWSSVSLPALRFSGPANGNAVRITRVHALSAGDVWAEGAYRVAMPSTGERGWRAVRAGVLYRNRPLRYPLYCDASLPADEAIAAVDR